MYNRLQILSHSKNCCLGTLFLPPSGPVSQISGNSPLSCPGLSQIALGGHRSCSPSSSAHTQHGMQEKYLWNRRFQCVQVHSHGPIHHLALNPSVAQLSSQNTHAGLTPPSNESPSTGVSESMAQRAERLSRRCREGSRFFSDPCCLFL